jgi:hypothetical protein
MRRQQRGARRHCDSFDDNTMKTLMKYMTAVVSGVSGVSAIALFSSSDNTLAALWALNTAIWSFISFLLME